MLQDFQNHSTHNQTIFKDLDRNYSLHLAKKSFMIFYKSLSCGKVFIDEANVYFFNNYLILNLVNLLEILNAYISYLEIP